ncbi:hypothetical protein EBN88_16755 [Streptomyces triticirhizae]|uniref:Uncharacterized protein n=1 Tax=Streptomyces triticirhizae TaxID=2483353 RepID=A0A3M2LMZ7_9ACTN|nr:hypothetical protein EBN88_16755 [Streptomyces triticirhizae]
MEPDAADPERTVAELARALGAHGITLPSLGLDGPSMFQPFVPPLIELGCVTEDTARKIIQALTTRDSR